MELHWNNPSGWIPIASRRGAVAAESLHPLGSQLGMEMSRVGLEIAVQQDIVPRTTRGVDNPPIDFNVVCAPEESAVIVLRYPSGAKTFHSGLDETISQRGRATTARSLRFRVEVADRQRSDEAPARRGLESAIIKVIVVKIRQVLIDAAVSAGLRAVSLSAESLWWKQRKLTEGWHAITSTDNGIRLTAAQPNDVVGERSLLFLHGTFSDTVGSYGGLLQPKFFSALKRIYQNRIFGFEHFSLSRSPEDNVRMLLEFLPTDRRQKFDVVSYSRGGLVLRTLVEQAAVFGAAASRFQLDHGILVAVPNGGTPLATGQRWEDTFGLLSTLLDLLPPNPLTPLTTAASFIADGIVWLAGHISGDLPGLAAMDVNGAAISALQKRSAPPFANYSSIGANHYPSTGLWKKLVDTGIDTFFAGANDLVVPSDGALTVDPGTPRVIPTDRVACFGPGGNLRVTDGTVHHLSIVSQDETGAFLLHALKDEDQNLPQIDLNQKLPSRQIWRGGSLATPSQHTRLMGTEMNAEQSRSETPGEFAVEQEVYDREGDCTLQIIILGEPDKPEKAQILAMYGSARVIEPFPMQDSRAHPDASKRFEKIRRFHTNIRLNLEGRISSEGRKIPDLPADKGLREFGELLFETLFTQRVRRLYDLARSEQRARPLNVIFTCVVPWLAAMPWEFSFDPNRRKFLATEELHFVRNVLTAVPAQRIELKRKRLRLLVVEAQPAGTAPLSIEEEERQIRFRFQPLIDSGLVEVEVLAQASPSRLHEFMVSRNLEKRPFDIVHFIGHGEFDSQADQGRLFFQSGEGYAQPVETQTLRELLCNRGLQLVFLNACDTAREAKQKLNRGVASALVEGGMPAVVANQYKVLDPSAVAFAQHFYWALANGATLGEAAREARIDVNCSMRGEIIDWAVPVLYARDPDRRLCRRLGDLVPLRPDTTGRQTSTISSAIDAPRREDQIFVGIADIARFFPNLEEIIDRLDSVQSRFVFRIVDVTTPVGVWEYDPKKDRTYLDADKFASKLRYKPKALGVDFLCCITNWWTKGSGQTDLYGWWSSKTDLPILIFSTAGLQLPTTGPAAGRIVANELVSGLGSQLFESNVKDASLVHEDGPADCPFFYNENRDPKSITERLTISFKCRQMLKRLPKKLAPTTTIAAFGALLAAFDGDIPLGQETVRPTKPKSTRKRSKRQK